LNKRLHGHSFKRRESSHTRRDRWIQLLKSQGLTPLIKCLAVVEDNGFDAERWWIAKFKAMGFDLVNSNEGGPGCIPGVKQSKPKVITPETREKIRASLKGRKLGFALHPENMHSVTMNAESERRRIEKMRGRVMPEGQKQRIRETNLETWRNYPNMDKHRSRAAASTKRYWDSLPPEERERRNEQQRACILKGSVEHARRCKEYGNKSAATWHGMTLDEYNAKLNNQEKWCSRCKSWKTLQSFAQTSYGHYARCRVCVRAINLKYRTVAV
jgi:hypothetical protein